MRRPADQALERRYRRLLSCYPAGYRAANAEEMLGVAMAGSAAAPDRRWPRLGEAVSLVVSGLGKRLGTALPHDGPRDRIAWLDAAAALTVIGPILLAAAAARTISRLGSYNDLLLYGTDHGELWAAGQAAGWVLVALLACLGLRWLTALGALAGLASEAVAFWRNPQGAQDGLLWLSVLAAVTAAAGLAALRGERRRVLSRRTIAVLAIAAAVPGAWPSVQVALASALPDGSGNTATFLWTPLGSATKVADVVWLAVGAIAVAMVVSRLRAAVRRRVMVAMFPVVVMYATYGGYAADSLRLGAITPFGWPPLAALIVVPVSCFAAGLLLLGRYERMLRRVASEGAAG
jgi:hypothetical protein